MTISTRINRKAIILRAKSFSKSSIGFPHLMTFCRNFILILYYQQWLITIKSNHWISNLLIRKTINNFRWSLAKAPILKCITLSSAKENRKFKFLTRLLTANHLIMVPKPAIIHSRQRKSIKLNNLTLLSKSNKWISVCQTIMHCNPRYIKCLEISNIQDKTLSTSYLCLYKTTLSQRIFILNSSSSRMYLHNRWWLGLEGFLKFITRYNIINRHILDRLAVINIKTHNSQLRVLIIITINRPQMQRWITRVLAAPNSSKEA